MLLLGAAVALRSTAYTVGSLTRMGPGFFPLCLGALLALVGLLMIATAFRIEKRDGDGLNRSPEWRGWICICLGVIAFALLARPTGIIPATFVSVAITAFGDRSNPLRDVVLLAIGVTIGAVVIFWWGLQVLLPLIAWDFG
jgi:hypothetical protein